mmetsp:Transcript_70554/g.106739  ORF Transcript_70554/g.106739 Transcript_70554/m.106739 type:complete len:321 (-) Transcript_70554:759-1721(-)
MSRVVQSTKENHGPRCRLGVSRMQMRQLEFEVLDVLGSFRSVPTFLYETPKKHGGLLSHWVVGSSRGDFGHRVDNILGGCWLINGMNQANGRLLAQLRVGRRRHHNTQQLLVRCGFTVAREKTKNRLHFADTQFSREKSASCDADEMLQVLVRDMMQEIVDVKIVLFQYFQGQTEAVHVILVVLDPLLWQQVLACPRGSQIKRVNFANFVCDFLCDIVVLGVFRSTTHFRHTLVLQSFHFGVHLHLRFSCAGCRHHWSFLHLFGGSDRSLVRGVNGLQPPIWSNFTLALGLLLDVHLLPITGDTFGLAVPCGHFLGFVDL